MSKDCLRILQVFPAEVWAMILGAAQHSSDICNIWNTSIYFRSSLVPKAIQILFPAVIKVIFTRCPAQFFTYEGCTKQMLKLRCVSRYWKIGVNRAIQDEKNYHHFTSIKRGKRPFFHVEAMEDFVEFRGVQSFEKFQRHFDTSHFSGLKNPFVFRGIGVAPHQVYRDVYQYYRACETFLKKYGTHIWFCYISILFKKCLSEVRFYEQLGKFLELMPNLRVLHFSNDSIKSLNAAHLKALAKRVSLPTLKRLKLVQLEYIPLPIVQEIVQNNQQIEFVSSIEEKSHGRMNMYLQLPFLNTLGLKLRNMEDYSTLCSANANRRISRLQLDLSELPASFDDIFQDLNCCFAESLSELYLCLPESTKLHCDESLELSKLKILHLELTNAVVLDCLIPLKDSLVELSLVCENNNTPAFDEAKMGESKILIYHCWEKPQHSSLWIHFSKLKILRTAKCTGGGWHVCTRV